MKPRKYYLPVFRMTAFGPMTVMTLKGPVFARGCPVPPMSTCVCDWRLWRAHHASKDGVAA